jgi:hypothetical protein
MRTAELAAVALLAIQRQRIALCLAPEPRWQDLYGLRAARLELPGAAHTADARPAAEALALGPATLGARVAPLPTRWTYGPSPRHAVDRAAAPEPADQAPFLRFERMLPNDAQDDAAAASSGATRQAPQQISIAVYRAAMAEKSTLDARVCAALVWTPVEALRTLVAGMRLGDALALDGVKAHAAPGMRLPDELLLYLPSDYGERHLARIAAKYGSGALFASP